MAQEESVNGRSVYCSKERTDGTQTSGRSIMVSNDSFSKLVFLRRKIVDTDNVCTQMRRLVNNINEEIYATNEEIKNKLLANQKRLEVLADARERLERYETTKLLSYEEFVSIINLDGIYENSIIDNFISLNVKSSHDE